MKLKRMLTIPGLVAGALVLAACTATIDTGPFPNEEPREVTARFVNDAVAEGETVDSNGSQLYRVNIPAEVQDNDVVWFELRETNGVESITLYDISALGQATARLVSVDEGWFDVPGSVNASPPEIGTAQITEQFSCAGPCVAIAGDEAGSARYLRVDASRGGAEFDLYVFGSDFDYAGGNSRSEAVEIGLDVTTTGAITLSGQEQWYLAHNVRVVTLSQFGEGPLPHDEMRFEADIYVGNEYQDTLDTENEFHPFDGPTNNVFIKVKSLNDTRAAAAGEARFTLIAR